MRQGLDPGRIDPTLSESDLLRTGNHQTLPFLERGDKTGRFEKAVVCTGIEPSMSAAERFDVELSPLEVAAVHVGDLQLAPGRRFEARRDVTHVPVVKVQASDRETRLGGRRLLFDAE